MNFLSFAANFKILGHRFNQHPDRSLGNLQLARLPGPTGKARCTYILSFCGEMQSKRLTNLEN